MNNSTITKPQSHALAGSSGRSVFLTALGLAMLLCVSPIITSTEAQAKEPTPTVASVNINNADAQTLAAGLKGVGLSRAKEIVRYRETYGPFASIDELEEVKGVGPSTIEKNRALLTLE